MAPCCHCVRSHCVAGCTTSRILASNHLQFPWMGRSHFRNAMCCRNESFVGYQQSDIKQNRRCTRVAKSGILTMVNLSSRPGDFRRYAQMVRFMTLNVLVTCVVGCSQSPPVANTLDAGHSLDTRNMTTEWLTAEVLHGDELSGSFLYRTSPPPNWKTASLTEQVSITWRFSDAAAASKFESRID